MPKKQGILFVNLGGPDSLQAVKPFLYNLFSDPDIIRLPLSWLLQKPLAWLITTSRGKSVMESYGKMGGRSPILPLTEAQALALEARLREKGLDLPVYIAMRYWHPFTDETLDKMVRDGIEEIIVMPLYPHYSLTTTGSSVNELEKVMAQKGLKLPYQVIDPYYKHPDFQAAIAETIQEGLAENPWSCPTDQVHVMFSAHSLPKKFVKRTQDVYPGQIYETCQLLMKNFFPNNPWDLGFQSKVGKMPWLGPDTEGVLHYYAANDIDNILMVPISFVSDHLETLYEIDLLYLELAKELKIPNAYRTKALNDRPTFIQAMTNIVTEFLDAQTPSKPLSEIPH
jgi:protoporphyrin/coproporphyrin ferrochelatase